MLTSKVNIVISTNVPITVPRSPTPDLALMDYLSIYEGKNLNGYHIVSIDRMLRMSPTAEIDRMGKAMIDCEVEATVISGERRVLTGCTIKEFIPASKTYLCSLDTPERPNLISVLLVDPPPGVLAVGMSINIQLSTEIIFSRTPKNDGSSTGILMERPVIATQYFKLSRSGAKHLAALRAALKEYIEFKEKVLAARRAKFFVEIFDCAGAPKSNTLGDLLNEKKSDDVYVQWDNSCMISELQLIRHPKEPQVVVTVDMAEFGHSMLANATKFMSIVEDSSRVWAEDSVFDKHSPLWNYYKRGKGGAPKGGAELLAAVGTGY